MSRRANVLLADVGWILFWGILSSLWCVTAASQLSATFDEPFYLEGGLKAWRTGSFKALVDKGTMPLPMYVTTAPIYAWECWRGQPFDVTADLEQILPVARAMTLTFWWLLLLYAWWAARELAGPWAGRLAIGLIACEPTFLAHAALATTDVAVSACLLAFLVHFRAGRGCGWWKRIGLPTVWFTAATLAKVSGMVFGVIGMVVLEAEHALRTRPELQGLRARTAAVFSGLLARQFRWDLFQVGLLGLVLVFVFCGTDWKPSPSFVKWAEELPEGRAGDSMRWVAEHARVFSNAGNALGWQIRRNIKGQEVYLLGRYDRRAIWYYFPVALSIKLTIPLLLLPLVVGGLAPGALRNWVCALAGVLFLYALNCRVQLGVRLLLPLVALLAVGLATALTAAVSEKPWGWRSPILLAMACAAPLWMGWAAWSCWPNGLSYINEAWGGPADGYRLLTDSNYDWGQGLPELAAWQKQHGDGPVDVIYFGQSFAARQPTFHVLQPGGWPRALPSDLRANAQGRYLAVSTSLVYGPVTENPHFRALGDWLKATPPVDRTTTFLIYDLRQATTAPAGASTTNGPSDKPAIPTAPGAASAPGSAPSPRG